jgi:hypothetical protein
MSAPAAWLYCGEGGAHFLYAAAALCRGEGLSTLITTSPHSYCWDFLFTFFLLQDKSEDAKKQKKEENGEEEEIEDEEEDVEGEEEDEEDELPEDELDEGEGEE